MGSRAHCHSGPEFLTRAAKLSHDSNKREALERHDCKEGKVANMEANLSWLLHTQKVGKEAQARFVLYRFGSTSRPLRLAEKLLANPAAIQLSQLGLDFL